LQTVEVDPGGVARWCATRMGRRPWWGSRARPGRPRRWVTLAELGASETLHAAPGQPQEPRAWWGTRRRWRRVTGRKDRYAISGEIGRGGGGQVVRAYDRDSGRTVAMKVLNPPRGGADPLLASQAVLRFWAEAQIASQLEHPNIMPVYDIGSLQDGRPYYTMKEIRGWVVAGGGAEAPAGQRVRRPRLSVAEVAEHLSAGVPRGSLRARAGGGASGLEAGQRDVGGVRRGLGDGLGFGEGDGERRGDAHVAAGWRQAQGGADGGDAELHAAGAGAGARTTRWTSAATSTRWGRRCTSC
jgi:hypothetical protein